MKKTAILPAISLIFTFLAGLPVLYNYWALDIQLILCLLLAPFAFRLRYPQQNSLRYIFPASLFLGLFWFTKIKLCFLLGVGFSLFLIIEANFGKLGEMPIFFLGLLSPVLPYFAKVFTFPIRLWLSQVCWKIFKFFKFPINVSGNIFEIDNLTFAVDTACMGLNMLSSSLAVTTLLIAFEEQKSKKRLPPLILLAIFGLAFILITIANLFRIITLVILRAMPETIGHEIIGLLCWGLYVIVPLYFLLPFLYPKKGISIIQGTSDTLLSTNQPKLALLISFQMLIFTLALTYSPRNIQDSKAISLNLKGFRKSIVENQVIKFENDSFLIYVKPAVAFYGTDHNPTICWQASGYTFAKMEEIQIQGLPIFMAELHKEKEILYTAWWYDNGKNKTIAQLQWRWEMIKGQEPYRLINVSAKNRNELKEKCKILLLEHWF